MLSKPFRFWYFEEVEDAVTTYHCFVINVILLYFRTSAIETEFAAFRVEVRMNNREIKHDFCFSRERQKISLLLSVVRRLRPEISRFSFFVNA